MNFFFAGKMVRFPDVGFVKVRGDFGNKNFHPNDSQILHGHGKKLQSHLIQRNFSSVRCNFTKQLKLFFHLIVSHNILKDKRYFLSKFHRILCLKFQNRSHEKNPISCFFMRQKIGWWIGFSKQSGDKNSENLLF